MADGRVEFEVVANDKSIKSSIRDITKEIEKESRKWDDAVDDSTDSMEDSFSKFFKGVAKGIAAAGIGKMLLDIGKASISAASDLAEVQNVVDVTFGEGAAKIEAWSKTAGTQFGLTETQAKRFTSTLGAMMKSAGMSGDKIVGMSTDLAGLAADMASFYNLDFETAFEKIRSGISGETEPLKQLGINMSVANLEAFALEKGITKSFAAMSQGEQTMLRYQYLMQATADAQGDFARTSDGFANASRVFQTQIETLKTKLGTVFLPVVNNALEGINNLVSALTQEHDTTVLDDFSKIDVDTASKMADLEATYNKASDILKLIKEISETTATLSDGSTITFGELFEQIGSIEANGGDIGAYISGLGLDADFVTKKYQEWKEATKQLTSTIPSLTSVINSETGAIDGGTDALEENLKQWKANEEQKLAWSAYYAKERALAEKKASMYLYQFDADSARVAAEEYRKFLKDTYGATFDENGKISADTKFEHSSDWEGSQWFKDAERYTAILKKETETKRDLEEQTVDYSDAEKQLEDGLKALEERYGKVKEETEGSTAATQNWTEKQEIAGRTVIDTTKALAEYVQSVRDATETAVDSVVKGFDRLTRPTSEMEEKRSKLIEQQNALNTSTEEGKRKYQELQKQIDDLNKSMDQYSASGMKDSLKSQLAFMNEYIDNLEQAQRLGLSDDLLASLSDGSVQSAEYLAQLVANPQQAAEVDALYQQVQKKKGEFTTALTDQKLTVDETYQGMVDTAKKAIEDLDLGEDATSAMGNTVEGLAKGISEKVPDVKTAVDALLTELSRLNGLGININLGSFYSGGYAAGAGRPTMNYDGLSNVMGASGGNVYLDGRQVGSVMSAQQGNSYRQLQRSGWRAP